VLRLIELALLLAPFLAYAAWRLLAADGEPSLAAVAAAVLGLLVLAGGLIWFGVDQALGPGQTYVPAHWERGQIVPGHAAPR
jgi:Family of unknown function (DUF6111)